MTRTRPQTLEECLDGTPVVLTPEGRFTPADVADVCDRHGQLDILLVASPTSAHENVPVGLQRLADACVRAGQRPGILFRWSSRLSARTGMTRPIEVDAVLAVARSCRTVGVSVFDQDAPHVVHLLDRVASLAASVADAPRAVFLGGPGPTTSSSLWGSLIARWEASMLAGSPPVTIIRGDGELALPALLTRVLTGADDAETARVLQGAPDEEFLPLPMLDPRWQVVGDGSELLEMLEAWEQQLKSDSVGPAERRAALVRTLGRATSLVQADVELGRGCEFRCTYCSTPGGRAFRAPSPDEAVAQLRSLLTQGRFWVVAVNNNLFHDPGWWRAVARKLEGEPLAKWLSISGFGDPRTITRFDDAALAALARVGVRSIRFGLESTDPDELARMGRRATKLDAFLSSIEGMSRHGIEVSLNFIDYFPGWQSAWFNRILPSRRRFLEAVRNRIGHDVHVSTTPFMFLSPESQPALHRSGASTSPFEAICIANGLEAIPMEAQPRRLVLPLGSFGGVYWRPGDTCEIAGIARHNLGAHARLDRTLVMSDRSDAHPLVGILRWFVRMYCALIRLDRDSMSGGA